MTGSEAAKRLSRPASGGGAPPQQTHLDAIRQRLRIECDELGDNTWPDDLHLAGVIDRYLCRPVRDQIQSLNEEIVHLRDRERDVERGLVAEIAGYLTQLGHNWFADGDTRNSQIAYDLSKLVERGDWRAQPQPQPEHAPPGRIAYTLTTNLYGEGEVTPVEACPHGVPYCWPCDECDAEVPCD